MKSLTKEELIKEYDKLQIKYGSPNCNSVYGGGCENSPELFLVFINPTARNIATKKGWKGVRYQWLGTKQVWNFLTKCEIFDEKLNTKIQSLKPNDWSEDFCKEVYNEVSKQKIYITNLAKCTQDDARALPDSIFESYKHLLFEEIEMINPQKIILFGNQVSSIVLDQKISVSTCRKQLFKLKINNKTFDCFPVFYPVGNGFFNAPKAIEDIEYILNLK